MSAASFAFKDRNAARRAAEALVARGIAQEAVRVHTPTTTTEQVAAETDEIVTGGFLSSFADLFEGIFHGNDTADRSALLASVAHHGGEVVSVNVTSEMEQQIAEEVMSAEQPTVRTEWVAASGR